MAQQLSFHNDDLTFSLAMFRQKNKVPYDLKVWKYIEDNFEYKHQILESSNIGCQTISFETEEAKLMFILKFM